MAGRDRVRSRAARERAALLVSFSVCALVLLATALDTGCVRRAPAKGAPAASAPAGSDARGSAAPASGKSGTRDAEKPGTAVATVASPAKPAGAAEGTVPAASPSDAGAPASAPSAPTSGDASSRSRAGATTYVFSPSSVVSASPSAPAAGAGAGAAAVPDSAGPSAPSAAGGGESGSSAKGSTFDPEGRGQEESEGARELRLWTVASASVIPVGATVTVDVMADSGVAIVDAPVHVAYDPGVLAFLDGAPGDFLTRGGSSVVFLVDGSSRPGDVAVAVGRTDRSGGARGSGLLCRLRFTALRAGDTVLRLSEALAWDAAGQSVSVVTFGGSIAVR